MSFGTRGREENASDACAERIFKEWPERRSSVGFLDLPNFTSQFGSNDQVLEREVRSDLTRGRGGHCGKAGADAAVD